MGESDRRREERVRRNGWWFLIDRWIEEREMRKGIKEKKLEGKKSLREFEC